MKRLGHDFSKNCFCIGSMGIWRLMKNSHPNVSGYYWMAAIPSTCLSFCSPNSHFYARGYIALVHVLPPWPSSRSDHWKFCSSAISQIGKATLRSLPIACMTRHVLRQLVGSAVTLRLLPMMVYNSGNITCLGVSGGCTSGQLREMITKWQENM